MKRSDLLIPQVKEVRPLDMQHQILNNLIMPHKNTVRIYYPGGHYHVYNRGVEKRIIFTNKQDYETFLSLIEYYLTPTQPDQKNVPITHTPYWRSKLEDEEVELISYCLMSNHFHLLLKQNTENGITKFMRRLSNAYVKYFNKEYKRVGALYQGKFKAAPIDNDPYLLHLSRYIHLNPLEVRPLNIKDQYKWLQKYPYSSYPDYLRDDQTPWLKPNIILSFFKSARKTNPKLHDYTSYQSFVENYQDDPQTFLGNLTLEET